MPNYDKGHVEGPMSQHLDFIRSYAKRVLIEGEYLSAAEARAKEYAFQKISEIGGACRMTEREMGCLMLRGVLNDSPPCWCSVCRTAYTEC